MRKVENNNKILYFLSILGQRAKKLETGKEQFHKIVICAGFGMPRRFPSDCEFQFRIRCCQYSVTHFNLATSSLYSLNLEHHSNVQEFEYLESALCFA